MNGKRALVFVFVFVFLGGRAFDSTTLIMLIYELCNITCIFFLISWYTELRIHIHLHIQLHPILGTSNKIRTVSWREDLRCGPKFPIKPGTAAKCNPDGEFPCCSPRGWCGKTNDHCECSKCINYSTGPRPSGKKWIIEITELWN